MKIHKHTPGFAASHNPKDDLICEEFNSIDELMEIPWIKSWNKDMGGKRIYRDLLSGKERTERFPIKKFHKFSISKKKNGRATLMVEYDNGYSWYVVGFIADYNTEFLDSFDEWKPKEEKTV